MDIFIFGHNPGEDIATDLQNLVFSQSKSPLVSEFLLSVSYMLQRKISHLPYATRSRLPPFSNLGEFIIQYVKNDTANPVIETVFLSIIQLAEFIAFQEAESEDSPRQKNIISVSTGLIAGATAAILPRGAVGVDLAVHAVQVTLRLALYIQGYVCSLVLEGPGEIQDGWALDIGELQQDKAQDLIRDFLLTEGPIAETQVPYISTIWPTSVTISGPPPTLSQLKIHLNSNTNLSYSTGHSFGPHHAPHLHKLIKAEDFLDLKWLSGQDLAKLHTQSNALSTRNGDFYHASSIQELYTQVITDILVSHQDLAALFAHNKDILSSMPGGSRLLIFGPLSNQEPIMLALQSHLPPSCIETLIRGPSFLSVSNRTNKGTQEKECIAIVGMSGRFPGAENLEEFWKIIKEGLDMHKEVPIDRFDIKTHYDPSGKGHNKSHTPFGCFIDRPGLFDPRFFNMSPREAMQTDPMQRLALITAYEALELSGYVPNRTPSTRLDRIGTFYGQTSDDWREINAAQEIDTYFITGGVRAFGPGRINYHFGFSGPSFSVDTACSSSFAAIHTACNALWLHDCDTAVAGGMNLLTNPDIFAGLSKGRFLSKTGPCQTFDNEADGYCRGDAVATIVLKRLGDAEADCDNVLGIIRSISTNHSADAISITHPHAGTQEKLYRRVLAQAGVKSQDISYVEMHGTGTQAGDNTEMESVINALAPLDSRALDQKLYVGSVKANIGHGEASSGISSLIKSLLMMRHCVIPPHVGIKTQLNKGFPDLNRRNICISKESIPWKDIPPGSRKILLNNFSAAGGNTAMVLIESKCRSLKGVDPRKTQVVAVSARSLSSLKTNLENLLHYLSKYPDVSMPSLSYTTTARRVHYDYRVSVAASSLDTVKTALAQAVTSNILPVPRKPKIVFTFTGQGSMYPAVGSDLFKTCRIFRDSLIEFDSISISCGFPSLRSLVDGSLNQPLAELSPVLLQVVQVSIQMALTRMWKSLGIVPDVVIGHSLGEYAAFFASGILSAAEIIYLVGSRARLMEMNCTVGTHSMLAVRGDDSNISASLIKTHRLHVACINSTKESVLSGLSTDMESLQCQLKGLGFKTTCLNVPYAFHSSQVDAIISSFRDICSKVVFRRPKCEVLSSTLGKSLGESPIDSGYLCQHARQTVNFHGALADAISGGIIDENYIFLEIGPSPVCNTFVKSTLGFSTTTCASLHRDRPSWDVLANSMSEFHNRGLDVYWSEYHRDFEDSLELLELPSYGWTLANYWIDYQGDWCLEKGTAMAQRSSQSAATLSTTTVHRIIKEKFGQSENIVIAETDMSEPAIRSVVEGHMVNNVALCPSSLYGDIGMTLGAYMYRSMHRLQQDEAIPAMDVKSMAVNKTLILSDTAPLIININAKAIESKESIQIKIASKEGEHASFTVKFSNEQDWIYEWKRVGFLVESRMETLRDLNQNNQIHAMHQEVAYKLFSTFVDYDKAFQGMKKVYLDALHWEATADIVLGASSSDKNFTVSPYWIDSIGHLSGFVLNVQISEHDPKHVYVSHGWDSLRIAKTLVPGVPYRTYVRMMEVPGGNLVSGDVYCFEQSTVIAVFGGVTFMRIPRTVLDQVLPRPRPIASNPNRIIEPRVIEPNKSNSSVSSEALSNAQLGSGMSPLSQVLTIVAEECGVDQIELADDINFANLGVDSLLQLAISSRIREETCLEILSSVFIDHPTVGSLKSFIRSLANVQDPEDLGDSSSTMSSQCNEKPSSILSLTDETEASTDSIETWDSHIVETPGQKKLNPLEQTLATSSRTASLSPQIPDKHATSFLLQGNPKNHTKKLFLFPDGGGSASSYTNIPNLSPDIAVYGLNSPFMTTPEEYTCGVSGIARYFLQEIKRRQDKGPYNIGGWSAGGVIAYEGAQQLIRSEEVVERLILIDAPCPLTIEPLPSTLHQWFNSIGLLGDGQAQKTHPWLLPHFQASINALSTYDFRALKSSKAPATYLIWCEDGVCKYPSDPRPDPYPYGHAQFLLENKEDLGPQLWDALVGMQNIQISSIPGNHFSMMKPPHVENLGTALRKAFE